MRRVHEQEEAARISREIDESLQETKKLIERRKKATKVLLLGELVAFTLYLPRTHCTGRSSRVWQEHYPQE